MRFGDRRASGFDRKRSFVDFGEQRTRLQLNAPAALLQRVARPSGTSRVQEAQNGGH
jgi:hypothetical protein